ncbi:MAG: rRNA maturation RNase YbeY [Chitinophagaceae bacterium]|nr:rRNA maturation RNase YbeY [Chitinophagaceae bacterium]
MSKCAFHDLDVNSMLMEKRKLGSFLKKMIKKYTQRNCDLNYIFCSDEYLVKLNKQFLRHNTYTDIITFDLSENENLIKGEIYISAERVTENAKIFKVSYINELYRVILHGALHLSGFGDKSKKEKEEMRSLENENLNIFINTI